MTTIPCDPNGMTVFDPNQPNAFRMFFPGTDDTARFIAVVADEFAAWERLTTDSGDRDEALIGFTLRALAEQGLPFSAQALETIDRRRAVTA